MSTKTLAIAFAAAMLAACTTKGHDSDLVLTKVLPGKPGATPGVCTIDPGDTELDILPIGPSNAGHIGAVVENRLTLPQTSSTLRLNTADFIADKAIVESYELTSPGSASFPPANNTRAASGYIPSGTNKAVGVILFNNGELGGIGLADGAYFRITFHVEGHLQDGSSVRTSSLEKLFQYCAGTVCSVPTSICL